jgi:hypothetical protein
LTTLASLAEAAAALRDEPYNSPKVKLWKRKARDYVGREYGEEYLKILHETLFFRRSISRYEDGQQMHRDAMDNAGPRSCRDGRIRGRVKR